MDMEQPEDQDSRNAAPQPAELDELTLDTSDANDGDDDLDTPPEDEEEIEVGGKRLAVPKSVAETLKAERLMQADYTRKTQEVAEQRKAIEAQAEEHKASAAQHQQYLNEVAQVISIDKQLAAYQKIDWNGLWDTDPVAAGKYNQQMLELKNEREQVLGKVAQQQQEAALNEQRSLAKQIQDANAYLQREIPGWSPERDVVLEKFTTENGIPKGALANVICKFPALAKLIHKAELYTQLEKKQSTKTKASDPPPAPVTRIGAARPTAAKDPDKMTTEEWLKWRNADLAKKRNR